MEDQQDGAICRYNCHDTEKYGARFDHSGDANDESYASQLAAGVSGGNIVEGIIIRFIIILC